MSERGLIITTVGVGVALGALIAILGGLTLSGLHSTSREIAEIQSAIADLRERMARLDSRMETLESRMVRLESRMVRLDARMANIDGRLGTMERLFAGHLEGDCE